MFGLSSPLCDAFNFSKSSGVRGRSFLISVEDSLEISLCMRTSSEHDLKKLALCNENRLSSMLRAVLWGRQSSSQLNKDSLGLISDVVSAGLQLSSAS